MTDAELAAELFRLTGGTPPPADASTCVRLCEALATFIVTRQPASAPAALTALAHAEFDDILITDRSDIHSVDALVTADQQPGRGEQGIGNSKASNRQRLDGASPVAFPSRVFDPLIVINSCK